MTYYKVCSDVEGSLRSVFMTENRQYLRYVWQAFRNVWLDMKNKNWQFIRSDLREIGMRARKFFTNRWFTLRYKVGAWTHPRTGKIMVFGEEQDARNFAYDMSNEWPTVVHECVVTNPVKVDWICNVWDMDKYMFAYWKKFKAATSYFYEDNEYFDVGELVVKSGVTVQRPPQTTYLVDSCMLLSETEATG